MRTIVTLLLGLLASFTYADTIDPPLPALYGVFGVAVDDVLNVRDAPNASASIIGTLAPDARNVEVVSLSREGNWAQINLGEQSGWTAIRYLKPHTVTATALGLPVGLQCFGTEPFWDITFSDALILTLNTPEGSTTHAITANTPAPAAINLTENGFRFAWRSGRDIISARILPGQCTDGMTDRRFGLHYVDDMGLRSGCCSLR